METNLEMFKTSNTERKQEKEGVWMEIDDKTAFLVKMFGGANSMNIQSSNAKFYKPYSRLIESGELSDDKKNEIMIKVFVDSCMVDWRGVEIDKKQTAFSKEEALRLFKELPALCSALIDYSSEPLNYRDDVESLGN